jgi:hypothetical protein
MTYTFPFDTCEKPQESGVAQPFSVFVNIITCSIILYFLLQTKSSHAFLLLLALLIFELFHTFSHSIHIKGTFQYTITHIAGFLFNVALLNFLYRHTKVFPTPHYIALLCGILVCDLYAFFNLSFIYFILTQICLFLAILFFYYPLLNSSVKTNLNVILASLFFIYVAFVNEKMNCESMLRKFPNFPFHVIIEAFSIVPIFILSKTFYCL